LLGQWVTIPTQYTLTFTAEEGGFVSTEGGTYDEGTEVAITATPVLTVQKIILYPVLNMILMQN